MTASVPVHVVCGPLGSGKTSTIRQLLAQRPKDERWAVLVNEFGDLGIDSASLTDATSDLAEVAGGCICCTTRQQLRVTLTRLLRDAQPDRLFIEPTGLGHPAGIIDLLREPGLGEAVSMAATIAVFDVSEFTAERLAASRPAREAFELADILLLNKADRADAGRIAEARELADSAWPPKARVVIGEDGALAAAVLEEAVTERRVSQQPDDHDHDHDHEPCELPDEPGPLVAPTEGYRRVDGGDAEHATVAWLFPPETVFNGPAVRGWFNGLPAGVLRAKGVVRTGPNRVHFNRVGGSTEESDSAWRRDSRVELILAHGYELPATVEGELLAAAGG